MTKRLRAPEGVDVPEGCRYLEVDLVFEKRADRRLAVRIGDTEIRALQRKGKAARLGITAPTEVNIRREL